jgi:hypothetical protein
VQRCSFGENERDRKRGDEMALAAGWARCSFGENERDCKCVIQTHGGLTFAAHGNVRLCIANHALCGECSSPGQERLA